MSTVRAPFIVCRFCSTSKLVGLFSLTIVIVPLPCVLNASIVAGLNTAPSDPPASGRFARILPSFALRITIIGCGGLRRRIARLAARREQHLVLHIQRKSIASALIAERSSAPTAFIVFTSTAVTLPTASCMTT